MVKFVPYSSRCKCTLGTMENYLTTQKGHGLIFSGNPLMNANDHVVGTHITHFGECAALTAQANGFPKKCKAFTPTPWINVNKTYIIEGAPALTMDSLLPCFYGGIISIVSLPPTPEECTSNESEECANDCCQESIIEDVLESVVEEIFDNGILDIVTALQFMNIDITKEELRANIEGFAHGVYSFGEDKFGEIIRIITENNEIEEFLFNLVENPISSTLSFQYNEESDFYYTNDSLTLQRIGGFTDLFDNVGGILAMHLDTEVINFDYGDKSYRLQLWKGNYAFGEAFGGEVGFYTQDADKESEWYETVCECEQIRIVQEIKDKSGETIMKHDTLSTSENNIENGTSYWNLVIRTDSGYTKDDLTQITTLYIEDESYKNAVQTGVQEFIDAEEEKGNNDISLTFDENDNIVITFY